MLPNITNTMASTEKIPIYIESVEVASTTTSSVEIIWRINAETMANILWYCVHYQKVASSYIQYGPNLQPSVHSYKVQNLVADTYYRLCVVMKRNDTTQIIQKCVDASTSSWHIPVSIGSSIGAVLALSMIVLVILLLRWPSVVHWRGKQKGCARKYDSMSSHFNEDLYDFSESVTMTAGHDDMFSEQSEGYVFELPTHIHHDSRHCNGNANYILHTGTHRKGSSSSTQKHSNHHPIQTIHHHHHSHAHCNNSGQINGCQFNGDILHHCHHNHQESNIVQDLNHNHHHHQHGDTVILHVNDESEDSEIDSNLINGLPHAHTEPILPSTNFYEFEMQDIREVNDMPEPEVKEQYLETSIDDDI